jgi:AbrB family looped-hinge helix DNA binding protein
MSHTADPRRSYDVQLGERGRLVLPSAVRRRLDLHPGDRLVITVEPDGDLRMRSAREVVRRFRGSLRELTAGRSLADELIAERRQEARREDER